MGSPDKLEILSHSCQQYFNYNDCIFFGWVNTCHKLNNPAISTCKLFEDYYAAVLFELDRCSHEDGLLFNIEARLEVVAKRKEPFKNLKQD